MKTTINRIALGSMFTLNTAFSAVYDVDQVGTASEQLGNQISTNYPHIDTLADPAKKTQLSAVITEVAGALLTKNWNHSSGQAWPLLDWNKVTNIETFYKDQREFLASPNPITQNVDEAAKFQFSGQYVFAASTVGEQWFRDWLRAELTGNQQNMKMLLFWNIEELGIDHARAESTTPINAEWATWQLTFDQSDKIGKAILLKCLTRWAHLTDDWDTLKAIHLSVFNGVDDDLKAVALVSSDLHMGDDVRAKWQDLADNSTNLKLKALAQQAIDRIAAIPTQDPAP